MEREFIAVCLLEMAKKICGMFDCLNKKKGVFALLIRADGK